MSYGYQTPGTPNTSVQLSGEDAVSDVLKVEPYCGAQYAILGPNGTAYCTMQSWYFTAGTYPTSGSYKISLDGGANWSASIPYNATAATVQTAVAALAAVGANNVSISGGPVNTAPLVVTFLGSIVAAGSMRTATFDETNGGSGGLDAGTLVASPLFKNGAGACFGISITETAAGAITVYDALIDTGKVLAVLKANVVEGDYLNGGFRFANALMISGAAASKVCVRCR